MEARRLGPPPAWSSSTVSRSGRSRCSPGSSRHCARSVPGRGSVVRTRVWATARRCARRVLGFAFDGLGARVAETAAFLDNGPSNGGVAARSATRRTGSASSRRTGSRARPALPDDRGDVALAAAADGHDRGARRLSRPVRRRKTRPRRPRSSCRPLPRSRRRRRPRHRPSRRRRTRRRPSCPTTPASCRSCPSADIIPPMSGIPEPEKMLPPLPAAPAASRSRRRRSTRYQIGNQTARRRPRVLLDVLQAALEDVFDLVLETERGAPHDGLVRRVEPVEPGLVHDLLHRSRLGHRLLERPPVRREHRPDHGAGHGHRRHRLGDEDDDDAAGDRGAPPISVSPEIGTLSPMISAIDAADDRERATTGPARRRLARRLGEPAARDDVVLERLVERRRPTCRTWAGPRA